MSGGLIQLVTSGEQDVALTHNPEITFFKKVYKRHTKFALEIKEIYTEQQANYGDSITFNLSNADMIHRCFVQVDLPSLIFDDSIINNQNYLNWKGDYLLRLNSQVVKWMGLYTNFKNYVSIELLLYQQLLTLFLSDNITLNNIRELVIRFNNTYKTQKSAYQNLIDISIFNKINMSGYLLSLNGLLTYDTVAPNSNFVSYTTITSTLKTMYDKIQEYLLYYHTNWQDSLKAYNNLSSGSINFAWSQYLGHYYFSQFELDIGGQITEKYSADQFHIYQYHHLKEEQINNYNVMIGHDIQLYEFNINTKPSKVLLIPLIFFFTKSAGSALPLVAMRNTTVTINLTINKLRNLIYFRDWETEYNNFLKLTQDYNGKLNTNLEYQNYSYDPIRKKMTYNLTSINNTALQIIYPQLKEADINFIINTFGSNNKLNLNNWINFKNNLNKYPDLQSKIGGYDQYIDYNYLLNLIPKPKIKLLAEFIYLDDIERKKFTAAKLEYVIEGFQENIFDVNNLLLFDGEISIDRPNKYFKWFIQPKNFLNGLSEYGKVTPYKYDYSKYYKSKIFTNQILTLNQVDILKSQFDPTYYNYVQGYKLLNRTLPDQVYFYSFSLYPEEIQPSGTTNLTAIREKRFRYELNQSFLNEYFTNELNPTNIGLQLKFMTSSYNFFVVQNGLAKIIFSIS